MKSSLPGPRWPAIVGRLRPETLFLILSCTFGLAVLFANAPFQAPDETDHYLRVFQISEGNLIGEKRGNTAGGELPQAAGDVTNTEGIPFHYERKMTRALFERMLHPVSVDWSRAPRAFQYFPHTVTYPPAGYLPQSVAVFFGRALRIGPLGLMYLARLAGFAASVALGFAALRILPVYRWTTLMLLLCPMSLYLFGSIASDGLLIGGAALLIALLARLEVHGDRRTGPWDQLAVLALAGLVVLAKPVYLPLAGVAWLLVIPRLGPLRGRMLFSLATIACCVLPALVWSRVAAALYVPADGNVPLDPRAQAHVIVGAPLEFLRLVAHTVGVQHRDNFRWMVGTLGWGDTPMPGWFYPAFGYGVLGCLVMESDGARKLGWRFRFVLFAAALASALLIYAALYAYWNPPGSHRPIVGVEGRYFLPLLPLAVLAFPPIPPGPPRVLIVALAGILSTISAAVCLWAVIFRYYGPPQPSPLSGRTARLTSISTRALVGTKENILITGLGVSGPGLETLLIRAEGPGLAKLGLSGVLAHPSLRVMDSDGAVLASNTGWWTGSDPAQISTSSFAAGAPALALNSADSALIVSIPEGKYTIEVSGADGVTGIAREEIYELSSDGTRLSEISSRGYVGKGANMMVLGIVVGGTGTEALLGRADGPSLRQFGVTGALAQPTLEIGPLHTGAVKNTAWGKSPAKAEIAAASSMVGAFPVPEDSADSAAVVSIPPGTYTIKIYGEGGSTGVALAEVYELAR
jgi:hypothetical protein